MFYVHVSSPCEDERAIRQLGNVKGEQLPQYCHKTIEDLARVTAAEYRRTGFSVPLRIFAGLAKKTRRAARSAGCTTFRIRKLVARIDINPDGSYTITNR